MVINLVQLKELQATHRLTKDPILIEKVKNIGKEREKREKEKQLIKDAITYYCEKADEETQYQLGFDAGFDAGEDNVRASVNEDMKAIDKLKEEIVKLRSSLDAINTQYDRIMRLLEDINSQYVDS